MGHSSIALPKGKPQRLQSPYTWWLMAIQVQQRCFYPNAPSRQSKRVVVYWRYKARIGCLYRVDSSYVVPVCAMKIDTTRGMNSYLIPIFLTAIRTTSPSRGVTFRFFTRVFSYHFCQSRFKPQHTRIHRGQMTAYHGSNRPTPR